MINIYFCDDSESTVEKGKSLIKDYSTHNSVDIRLSTFRRAEDMLFQMADHYDIPHIIFLDIFMDELNGMDTAHKLRENGFTGEIIFLTTSPDFVFEAFDVQSFHYLVKQQVSDEKFFEVLESVIEEVEGSESEFFECSMGAEVRRIPLSEITHFEIYRRVMRVYYGEENFEFYETMDDLSEKLEDKGFVRVHRSFMVNMKHIVLFKTSSLVLSNEDEVPIGKTYLEEVKKRFSHYNRERWGN